MVADVVAYDEVAYPSVAHPLVRPDVMATLSRLQGLAAPNPARAAVLDLGCGDATHLISLAEAHPNARFVGVDLSSRAIERGRCDIAELGLANVELQMADLTSWRPEPGAFSYVLAHGLYAWTPPAVRDAVMAIVGDALAEGGLATVTFNVAPGCNVRLMVRELLLQAPASTSSDAVDRLRAARDVLEEALETLSVEDATGAALKAELEAWRARSAAALLHDLLAPVYAPAAVDDVATHAARHGLGFLGDAQRGDFRRSVFSTARDLRVRSRTDGGPAAAARRHDLLSANPFRHAILRKGTPDPARHLDIGAVAELHASLSRRALGNVGGPDDGAQPVTVRDPEGVEVVFDDLAAGRLLHRLEAIYPASQPVRELVTAGDDAGLRLLAHLYGLFAVDLSTTPSRASPDPGPRPLATSFARRQARLDRPIVRLDHSMADPDAVSRRLLAGLDGRLTLAEITEATAASMRASAPLVASMLRERLREMAREGLLLAAPA